MEQLGRVVESKQGLPCRVVFPETEHPAATSFLRDLSASDCSPATLRSYAYDLLRWFRFLHQRFTPWEKAERLDVRALVEYMQAAPTANALRRGLDKPAPLNAVTGKRGQGTAFSANSINHQLTVLSSFYDFALEMDMGPLVNPVPRQRDAGSRLNAHHNPMQPFRVSRRGTYRQRVPRPAWRGIPDDAVSAIFTELKHHRDRALLSFWLSSGVRAEELLSLRHGDYDFGEHTFVVTSKGTRNRDLVPASADAFVWLALYMREGQPASPGDPVWWTLAPRNRRPLTYGAARRMFSRAQKSLGSNWTLHDLRHTAAERMIGDPAFTLVDVQTVLRHAQVTTTTVYTQPRMEDVLQKVLEHYARPRPPAPTIEPEYDGAAVRELLGLGE
ncbi:tyrosine-type recombinase/integrase (plasmid) [Arthrobacter sp. FW305-123]|jgi:site-specific recombinase XerD|uniref:tyrosine-type recombinase/integrase n=1 Tax=Paenarthrobacter TaxID=1742992 RepID=UPI0024867593|nr:MULTISPECIES: site-specific integrase [Paenarthrobacter]MDI2020082.1 Tyrosine recombinase XerC [Paenarthrobacter nicotinovorans]MDI2035952.1 Tyrosine recombinase XerC [Paenarthrobacter nitroguajacolicus]UKA52268.1 tyrosine-type recombinase/integrase [Arthrobacter sp. FW305-123]